MVKEGSTWGMHREINFYIQNQYIAITFALVIDLDQVYYHEDSKVKKMGMSYIRSLQHHVQNDLLEAGSATQPDKINISLTEVINWRDFYVPTTFNKPLVCKSNYSGASMKSHFVVFDYNKKRVNCLIPIYHNYEISFCLKFEKVEKKKDEKDDSKLEMSTDDDEYLSLVPSTPPGEK